VEGGTCNGFKSVLVFAVWFHETGQIRTCYGQRPPNNRCPLDHWQVTTGTTWPALRREWMKEEWKVNAIFPSKNKRKRNDIFSRSSCWWNCLKNSITNWYFKCKIYLIHTSLGVARAHHKCLKLCAEKQFFKFKADYLKSNSFLSPKRTLSIAFNREPLFWIRLIPLIFLWRIS